MRARQSSSLRCRGSIFGTFSKLLLPGLLLLLLSPPLLAAPQPVESFYVEPGGVLRGSITLSLSGEGVAEVNLPCALQLVSVYSERGVPTFTLNGSTLQIYGDAYSSVNVTFTCRLRNDTITTLTVEPINQDLEIFISQAYIVLGVYPTPVEISYKSGYILLKFENLTSPLQLELVEAGLPAEGSPPSAPPAVAPLLQHLALVLAIALAAVVVIVAVLLARKRREGTHVLTEEDQAVISYLRSSGGKAYLKEIREALDLPSTTALRRVRKLEARGIVRTERTPGGLLVILLKR
jgi:uncharacterized membrane protein